LQIRRGPDIDEKIKRLFFTLMKFKLDKFLACDLFHATLLAHGLEVTWYNVENELRANDGRLNITHDSKWYVKQTFKRVLNSAFILDARKILLFLDDVLLELPRDRLLPPLLEELKIHLTEVAFDKESIKKMQVFQQKNDNRLYEAQKWSTFKQKGVLTEYKLFPQQRFSTDERLCFVLMPFDEKYNSIYKNVIKSAIAEVGLEVKRSDDIFGV
jgi:hypothetical protein